MSIDEQLFRLTVMNINRLLGQKCDIRRRDAVQGTRGGNTDSITLVESSVSCSIQHRTAQSSPPSQLRDDATYTHVVYLASRATPITTDHQFVSESRIFNVVEPINICNANVLWQVAVKEIGP